ncbi:MAG: hypothetical protein KC431_09075 [Myxococcales bacterium]|nr:hypothetical protein [Myxococcales bacterium]
MKLRLLAIAASTLACTKPPPSEQPSAAVETEHASGPTRESVVEDGEISRIHGGVTEDLMLERLEEVAQRYPDAVIERLALSDLLYPRNAEESAALQGFTIVLITATTQTPDELPPARVYVDCDDGFGDLPLVTWRKVLLETDWAAIVGPFRYDGIYLLPLAFAGRADCKLTMDWAKNRVGQVVTVFDVPVPEEVVVLPPGELPTEEVLRALIAREYRFVVLP